MAPAAPAQGHILLISPLTFSYHTVICNTLRSMGYQVTWWDERASSSLWYKLALRLVPSAARRWSTPHFLAKLKAIPSQSITHVMVIKGEGLTRQVAQAIRTAAPEAPMGFYLWDGVDNVRGITRIIDCFDCVASFDPVDASQFGWHHRPLFSSVHDSNGTPARDAPQAKAFDWCFIGTLHSDRHRVIHRLRQRSEARQQAFVFCFSPSRLMLWARRIADWTLWLAPRGTLSTQALPAATVKSIVARSRAVLDIEHPRQRGLTMRTIETLVSGHKLVTTNRCILESDLYHPSRVHVISREAPEIPEAFLQVPFEPLTAEQVRHYSCEGWARELIGQAIEARPARVGTTATPAAQQA